MERSQPWRVRTREGNEFTIFTMPGLDADQALNDAGLMRCDIEWIRQPS